MLRRQTLWVVLSIWAGVSLSAWGTLVPAWVSGSTLAWINAGALALLVTLAMVVREGRATRSVAHVLYDAEHQAEVGR